MNNFFNNLFNEYSLRARLYPAILCSVPFLLLKVVLVDKYIPGITEKILTFAIAGIPIWGVLVYLLVQVNRFISKTFFENKNNFPTLKMLMPSSKRMSPNMRNSVAERVKTDFGLSLPDLSYEKADVEITKTRIREIVGMIVNKVGRGTLLLQHNFEYGFVRNLMGGSVIAMMVSIIDIFIFRWILSNHIAFILSIIFSICYLIPIIFSRPVLRNYSDEYAEKLFREYLGSNSIK
jgi:hypothetical protein